MEDWEIAKKLLSDDGFQRLYQVYFDGVKLSRSFKSYWQVDLTTVDKT